nr:discoidin domain-containing protein [uncultured Methanoregula sp.]
MKVNQIIIGLFLMIALVGIASANINNFYIVVTDPSNNPISGASVTLTVPGYSAATHTTGSDGRPSLFTGYNVASPCTATITISKSGYTTYTSSDSFMEKSSTPGSTYDYYYAISTPQVTNIQVTVQDSVNHAVLPGATVSIPEGTPSTSTTDSTGKTGVISVPISGYHVTITKSGYTSYSVSDSVYYSATTQEMIYRPTAIVTPTPTPDPVHANVRYTIQDSSTSAVITSYNIVIRDNTNAVLESGAISGEQNHYYYFTPIPSSYSIEISKSGYSTYTHTYSSAPVDGSYITISLTPTSPTPTPTPGAETEYTYGTASASSAAESASNAFDHDSTTKWASATDTGSPGPGWLQMDYGNSRVINKYKITVWAAYLRYPTAWQILGSNDGSTWSSPLDSRSSQTFNQGETQYFTFSNAVSYRYYRLNILSCIPDTGNVYYNRISEWNLYNVATITPTPTPTSTPITPSATNIQITVQDSVNHAIIPGATVTIPEGSPSQSITDNTGKTGVIIVPTAGYHVTIESSGYTSYSVSDSVYYSATTQEMVYRPTAIVTPTPTQEPAHSNVRFTIRDADTSAVITGYNIVIKDNNNAVLESGAISGEENHYYYFSPIPSSWSIEISKSGYDTYTETITAAPVDGAFKTIYLTPADTTIALNVDIKSALTGYLIQGAHIGIYDSVHDVWRNTTAPTGMVYYDSTGANHEYPLTVGQTVKIAAWADDYYPVYLDVTIPYDDYLITLNLPPSSAAPTEGTYTVVFTVVSNRDQQPIKDVTVTSGLGVIKVTNSGGAATFTNVPIGSSRWFEFSGSGYQPTQASVSGVNGQVIMQTVELVPAGATPTPTPTPTVNTTARTEDLNKKGQTFASNWADMAIGSGGLVFLMAAVYFGRKTMR